MWRANYHYIFISLLLIPSEKENFSRKLHLNISRSRFFFSYQNYRFVYFLRKYPRKKREKHTKLLKYKLKLPLLQCAALLFSLFLFTLSTVALRKVLTLRPIIAIREQPSKGYYLSECAFFHSIFYSFIHTFFCWWRELVGWWGALCTNDDLAMDECWMDVRILSMYEAS